MIDLIDRRRAAIEQAPSVAEPREPTPEMISQIHRLIVDKTLLEARLEELTGCRTTIAEDAERYRWLRDQAEDRDWGKLMRDGGESLDDAIDAARSQAGERP